MGIPDRSAGEIMGRDWSDEEEEKQEEGDE